MSKGAGVSTRYTTFSYAFPQFPFGWAQNGRKIYIMYQSAERPQKDLLHILFSFLKKLADLLFVSLRVSDQDPQYHPRRRPVAFKDRIERLFDHRSGGDGHPGVRIFQQPALIGFDEAALAIDRAGTGQQCQLGRVTVADRAERPP